jgi:DNA-binding NarL/FixJ family response regulator
VLLAAQLKPDVVLMDVAMPLMNGIEATRQIKRDSPKVSVLILTAHEDEEYIRQALQSGAAGYLLKEADFGEVLAALRSVVKGDFVLSPPVTRLVVEEYLRWGDLQPSPGKGALRPTASAPPARCAPHPKPPTQI